MAKAYTEVRAIMLTEKHPELKELKINTVLNNVRDMGAQIAKNNLEEALNYVFKYIPDEKKYKETLPKFNEEKLYYILFH